MNTAWSNNTSMGGGPGAGPPPPGQDQASVMRSKTYTNTNRYSNRDGPGGQISGPPSNVDLPSMYFDQQQYFHHNPYNPYQQQAPQQQQQPSFPNAEQVNNGQFHPYNSFNGYQNNNAMVNLSLNPNATEFNPVGNPPQKQFNEPTSHYKEEFTPENQDSYQRGGGYRGKNDYQQQHQQQRYHHHHHAPAPPPAESEPEPNIEIPEGAVVLKMPQVYLGKFIMNMKDYQDKYGVGITTNSRDGGYLIIITGDQREDAGKEVELLWSEEPITTSDNITSGKHIIKVAPDRYEGVVCIPSEHSQILLDKRNTVETTHKVRILIKQLHDCGVYRAVIRANKKQTASDAADDLENIVLTTAKEADAAAPAK